jgi:O-antigen/teichoic acid export membrane protein
VAYRAFSDVAGKGAFFLVTVLAARLLDASSFGVFSLGTTLGWLVSVVTDFGIQLHLARELARRPADASILLSSWLRARLWLAGGVFGGVAIVIAATGVGGQYTTALLLFVLVYILGGLVEFLHYFYRGLARSDIESTFTLLQRFGMLACVAAALIWRPGLTALAFAMLLPAAATLAFSLTLASKMAREASRGATTEALPTLWGFSRDVLPIGVGIVLSAMYFRIDVFLIEFWKGITAVAQYNAVFRLVEALRLFPAAVLAVALPSLCRATNTRPLVFVSLWLTGFAALVSLVVGIAAGWLVPFVYGATYAGAVPAFRILLAAFPLMSLNYALTHQLVGWNAHRAYALIAGTALVFNVAINSRLIPAMSIAGAAWATLCTEAVLTIGALAALRFVTATAPSAVSSAFGRTWPKLEGGRGPEIPRA